MVAAQQVNKMVMREVIVREVAVRKEVMYEEGAEGGVSEDGRGDHEGADNGKGDQEAAGSLLELCHAAS